MILHSETMVSLTFEKLKIGLNESILTP